jgi:hypothetical protein
MKMNVRERREYQRWLKTYKPMAGGGTLGALWSQQLGFTVTTTSGTTYTHSLGYTPTVVILTKFGAPSGVSPFAPGYTNPGPTFVFITGDGSISSPIVDVTVGSFHSLIK